MKVSKKQEASVQSSPTKIVKTTLKELGKNLPIGVPRQDGSIIKSFDIRPWRMKEEKELGSLRDERRGDSVAKYVSAVLATLCTRIGPNNFEEISFDNRLLHISQMSMPDVFYVYCYLRYSALGKSVPMEIVCPTCRAKISMEADLESLEVKTIENLSDAFWDYKLQNPFNLRKKQVTGFTLGPAKWNALEVQKASGIYDIGAAKSGIIIGSIQKAEGIDGPPIFIEQEMDEMSKYDLEAIMDGIEKNAVGPDMAIEETCSGCKRAFRMSIDWSYDNFFGISSR